MGKVIESSVEEARLTLEEGWKEFERTGELSNSAESVLLALTAMIHYVEPAIKGKS